MRKQDLQASEKRAYETPELVRYGKLEDLTQDHCVHSGPDLMVP